VRWASRLLWLLASLTACSALAACGGSSPPPPALRKADAQRLIALSQRVETAGTSCERQRAIAQVRSAASRLIDSGRVPPALQESLSSGVNALVADQPACLPAVTAATTTTAPTVTAAPPAQSPAPRRKPHPHPKRKAPKPPHDHGPHGHPDHGHGHGHGGGHR